MDTIEKRVKQYFATDRGFASGKQLYNEINTKRISFLNALNRMNDTPANCAKLHYELAKCANINERGLKILLQKPMVKVDDNDGDQHKENNEVTLPDNTDELKGLAVEILEGVLGKLGHAIDPLPVFSKGLDGVKERKAFIKNLNIESKSKKNVDIDAAIAKHRNQLIVDTAASLITERNAKAKADNIDHIKSAPDEVKQGIRLRDQFPFLKHENCPDVYKVLTADLINAREKYVEAHAKIFDELTEEELSQACADVVEPYAENKLIFAELEHYQTKGESLGKHPIFAVIQRQEEIKGMSAADLAKEKSNLKSNISKTNKAMKKEGADKKKLKEKLVSFKGDLVLVITELETR